MKFNLILRALAILFISVSVRAQSSSTGRVSGRVVDEVGENLPGVRVSIPATHRGAIVNKEGRFEIRDLMRTQYVIEFSIIGYRTETRTVNLTEGDTTLKVAMAPSRLEQAPVIVTGKPQASDQLQSPQPISVVSGRELEQNLGATVASALAAMPGVQLYTTGSSVQKPVIRGLSGQRILIVSDGIRQEEQQWGDEHGIEIDALDVERIEVVRGPNSVLYGSDALGGVINIIRKEPSSADEGAKQLESELELTGSTNAPEAGLGLALGGAQDDFGYRANLSYRKSGDLQTPLGSLYNTGHEEWGLSLASGIHEDWGTISADYSHRDQRLELFEVESTPYQHVEHDRLHIHGSNSILGMRLETNLGYQVNDRQEFKSAEATSPALRLNLKSATADLKLHHQPIANVFGTIGLSGMIQKNEASGTERLIPSYDQQDLGVFLFEEIPVSTFSFTAGARLNTRNIQLIPWPDERPEDFEYYEYTFGSATLGAVWRPQEELSVALNLGRGARAPTMYELRANGVHEGAGRFEIGGFRLVREYSVNIDGGFRYFAPHLRLEVNLYHNSMGNYIYPHPLGRLDSASDFPIYQYRQAPARLFGGEAGFAFEVSRSLTLFASADLVRAQNDKLEEPLPLVPADRLKASLKFYGESLLVIDEPYLEVKSTLVAAQDRIAQYETSTPGYVLFDASIGGSIKWGATNLTLDLRVENLLNRNYRDHLSRYKLIAPNAGRSVRLNVNLPFTIIE